jgi:hypothetical protein
MMNIIGVMRIEVEENYDTELVLGKKQSGWIDNFPHTNQSRLD